MGFNILKGMLSVTIEDEFFKITDENGCVMDIYWEDLDDLESLMMDMRMFYNVFINPKKEEDNVE